MVRRSQSAFFKPWPAHSLPMPNGFFVALQRPSGGPLAAPAELAQDAPDVSFVIAHPALVLDQLAHPCRGPQSAGVAERLGSALERPLDLPQLAGAQFGLTPGPASLLQPRPPGLGQLPPSESPIAAQPPRHLTPAHALLEQLRGCHPPPFQSLKVPPHTCWITHSRQPRSHMHRSGAAGIDLARGSAMCPSGNRRLTG
jgi:hypothetical protein